MTNKKNLLVANWKLNHTRASAANFFDEVLPKLKSFSAIDIAVAPVAPMLEFVSQKLLHHNVALCAQNVFYEDKGAFTGEWSAEQLKEIGVHYCIVGHSERRRLFHETNADVAKKVQACVHAGIVPIICVGETEEERDHQKTAQVIERQVNSVVEPLVVSLKNDLVFAYEPVWAIGTGKSATSAQAQEVHQLIKEMVKKSFDVRILYGGSVNGGNIKEIVSMPDIDGALVGGASLQPDSFLTMVSELQGF